MNEETQPMPDGGPDITPPSLDSETWVKAQEHVLTLGNALREIAANAEEAEVIKAAINALIKTGLQDLFLCDEL